jgi:tetratricopeptide (TPR) repeat protein
VSSGPPATLSFGLLGPVRAAVAGVPIAVAGRHTQILLAALLLERDQVLPATRLIGIVWGRLGLLREAEQHLELALQLFVKLGDDVRQAVVHLGFATSFQWQGHNAEALRHGLQALELYRRTGNRAGQANALNTVGWCHAQIGDHAQALSACRQALALHRKVG